jgi:hypothetical protein
VDRITKSLFNAFIEEQGLSSLDSDDAFEYFSTYCVVSSIYPYEFSIDEFVIHDNPDTGLDGIAVIVNGKLVTEKEEIDDLIAINKELKVRFIFVQAKCSPQFNNSEMLTFTFGVKDFFKEAPSLPRSDRIKKYAKLQEYIYSKSVYFKQEKPICTLYYSTTGKWIGDTHLTSLMDVEIEELKSTDLFEDVLFFPIDSRRLQEYFNKTKTKLVTEINFSNHLALQEIENIKESYIGILPCSEFLKLIVDGNGNMRGNLFYDNVRDFLGDNMVNTEIANTITAGPQDRFILLNNGITVVSKDLQRVGNRFNIIDFQIVNGCQTSNVIYKNRDSLDPRLYVPIKLIVTDNDDVTNSIIKATNRQTSVTLEELEVITDFQKQLENFYTTFKNNEKLYYERRTGQYNQQIGIEKVRIVTFPVQIKAVASMFLNLPYRSGGYYSNLLKEIANNLFRENHQPMPYYTSAYCLYKLESLFRNRKIDITYRPFRYQMLMIFRIKNAGEVRPHFYSRKINDYCNSLNSILWDDKKAITYLNSTKEVINKAIDAGFELTSDTAKTKAFTDKVLEILGCRVRGK